MLVFSSDINWQYLKFGYSTSISLYCNNLMPWRPRENPLRPHEGWEPLTNANFGRQILLPSTLLRHLKFPDIIIFLFLLWNKYWLIKLHTYLKQLIHTWEKCVLSVIISRIKPNSNAASGIFHTLNSFTPRACLCSALRRECWFITFHTHITNYGICNTTSVHTHPGPLLYAHASHLCPDCLLHP